MIDWLIRRAQRTPYFHLPGYMNRYWLVPYSKVIERKAPFVKEDLALKGSFADFFKGAEVTYTDGTGPVKGFRPIARLLQMFDIAVRVHEILRSDIGRDPHDHPWPYLTVILKGGYWEIRYDAKGEQIDTVWHGPGSVLFRPAKSWHQLILPLSGTCWTLFITGRKQQTWGFNVSGTKVPYFEYKDIL